MVDSFLQRSGVAMYRVCRQNIFRFRGVHALRRGQSKSPFNGELNDPGR